jgi:heptosyltransferase I
MQTSLRANLISLAVKAKRRIGFDRDRAQELHSWVINEHIEAQTRQHQLDALMGFARHLGARPSPLRWDIPIPAPARERAGNWLYGNKPVLVINPCSSPSKRVHRSWAPENYAAVVDAAQNELGYTAVLVGGPSEQEKQAGAIICARASNSPVNLIGQTSLKELLAVLDRAEVLITSDSGPAHMANAVGTPVIALHAATNPYQTGPYLSLDWVVNKYPQAVKNEYGKSVEKIKWGTRVHAPNVMSLITPDDVIVQLKRFTTRSLSAI